MYHYHLGFCFQNRTQVFENTPVVKTDTVGGVTFTLSYLDGILTVTSDVCEWTVIYDTNSPFKTVSVLAPEGPYTGLCGDCPMK